MENNAGEQLNNFNEFILVHSILLNHNPAQSYAILNNLLLHVLEQRINKRSSGQILYVLKGWLEIDSNASNLYKTNHTLSDIPQKVKQLINILYMRGALLFFLDPRISIRWNIMDIDWLNTISLSWRLHVLKNARAILGSPFSFD